VSQSHPLDPVFAEIRRVLVGQDRLINRLMIGLLTDGHLLIEGLPGLAKTLAAKTLAQSLQLKASRIQFTPDLLPADLVGTQIYQPQKGEFTIRRGPIFANIIIADEINRAPAKVQSALLEAMQEHQVTLGEETLPLPSPFLVLATQNPIEQEGTYPLPEAQLDRFLLKVKVDYPNWEEERELLQRHGSVLQSLQAQPVLDSASLLQYRQQVDEVKMDTRIVDYLLTIVRRTREPKLAKLDGLIEVGASPRAGISWLKAAKAQAWLQGRDYVLPQDVKSLAPDVLRHRIIRSFEAEADGKTTDDLIQTLLETVPVP
jgi:MoxR-like ATPase